MVTGVETAGIVLAVLPLIISAIESYAEGVETIHKWWRYQRELASLKRILDAEYIRFLNTAEELLAGIVPDATLAGLLEDAGGVGWKDPELERRLRARLCNAYPSYLDTVADMNNVVSTLMAKLELDPGGRFKWNDSRKFRHEYKRIKFSLTKSTYEELMKRIEKGNDILSSLTGQSLRLEPMRLRRTHCTSDFDLVRSHAESLYRGLEINWCCTCQTPHRAILRLEARTTRLVAVTQSEKMRFRMLFSFDVQDVPDNTLPWKSKETDIEPLEDDEDNASMVPLSQATTATSLLSSRPKRGVRWASDTSLSSSMTSLTVSGAKNPKPSMAEIRNLCSAFQGCTGKETCLGFLVDEKRMKHGIYPVLHPTYQGLPMAITLQDRLAMPQSRSSKLSRKERLKLALTLASSLLQLYETSWLSKRWGINDILLLEGSNSAYVSKSFLPGRAAPQRNPLPNKSSPLVRNETIFALGVVLIELCLSQALITLREPEDLDDNGQENALTDYMTASRVLSDVYDEGGARYGDAVRRCIHCEFDQRKASLDVEALRQSFYQGVIQPLEDDWNDFCA